MASESRRTFPHVCTALDPMRLKRIVNYAKKIAVPKRLQYTSEIETLALLYNVCQSIEMATAHHRFPSIFRQDFYEVRKLITGSRSACLTQNAIAFEVLESDTSSACSMAFFRNLEALSFVAVMERVRSLASALPNLSDC